MKDTSYEDVLVYAYKKQSSASRRLLAGFLLGLFFDSEDGGYIFLQDVGFSELHGVTIQKTYSS
jgi:hypothetical protein